MMPNIHAASAFDSQRKSVNGGLIMPENGGFPCGMDGLLVLATDAVRGTTSRKGEGRTVMSVQSGQDAQTTLKSIK